ncbi:TPA: hypothetical protein DCZ39_06045 [Patescibacteria group bacterium]|nr:hypothetical protein [Candidatus Gracilibacteria bacterium]
MSGFCGSGGELYNKGIYGYVWSSSENVSTDTWDFGFSEDGGRLGWNDRGYARPVRPVLKSA